MKLYERMKDYFSPSLRARKAQAAALVAEKARREEAARLDSERSAILDSVPVKAWKAAMDAWGRGLRPGNDMDGAACFWFRKGLEEAVNKLDDVVASAEEGIG